VRVVDYIVTRIMMKHGRGAAMERVAVGRVAAIFRHPVKSLRGEALERAPVWWTGLEGDRRYAFTRGDFAGGFPWLTGRQIPEMLRYTASFTEPERPFHSAVRVRTPDGRDLPVESDELRAELAARYGGPISLLHLGRGAYDALPISVISTSTIATLGRAVGRALDPRRFRPNVLVEPTQAGDFPEDAWRGGLLTFGDRMDSAQVRVMERLPRCVMPNIEPETGERDANVLDAATRLHDGCAGMLCATEALGTIETGETIYWIAKG
jgi:uncharacterized protein YcbX